MTYVTLTVALLPTVVIMLIVIRNARAAKEPFKKLAKVFIMSALSVIPAAIIELLGEKLLNNTVYPAIGADPEGTFRQQLIAYFVMFFFVVGLAEEGCKYFTFKWMIFQDRYFDNTYDGIIYGACSALGFATLENLAYVFMNDNGPSLETAIMRAVLSIPMHAITGIIMGYYFGITKYRRYNNLTDTHPERKAFIFSVCLHGLYDFLLAVPAATSDTMSDSESDSISGIVLGAVVLLMICIYVLMGRTIRKAKKESHMIYNRYYYEQLNGQYQDMTGGFTSEKGKKGTIPFGQPTDKSDPFGASKVYDTRYSYAQQPVPPAQQSFVGRAVQQPSFSQYQQPQSAPQPQYYGQNQAQQPQAVAVKAYSAQAAAAPQPEQFKYCSSCGARIKAEARFCHICGVRS